MGKAEKVIYHFSPNDKGDVAAVEKRVVKAGKFVCMECMGEWIIFVPVCPACRYESPRFVSTV